MGGITDLKNNATQQLVDHARKLAVHVKEKHSPSDPKTLTEEQDSAWALACAVQSLCNALQAGGFVR